MSVLGAIFKTKLLFLYSNQNMNIAYDYPKIAKFLSQAAKKKSKL